MISRRKLLVALVVLIVGFGAVHIVHGSSTKHKHHHTCTKVTNKLAGSKEAGNKSGHQKACKLKAKHHVAKQKKDAARPQPPGPTPLQTYARSLKALLGRAVNAFNQDASSMSSQSMDTLSQTCSVLGTQTQILEYQVDGVPHPGTWNTPVTDLHFRLMDIFHEMLGATVACQTAASNQDWEGLSSAQSDASTAASALQGVNNYVHAAAR